MIKKIETFEKDGKTNDVYRLSNTAGNYVDILTYGARIIRIAMPDKKGKLGDCIVGCKKAEDYYNDNPYFGATIGRYGNRIGGAAFSLNGERYTLEANEKTNTLHSGTTANFDRQIWSAEIEKDTLLLSHVSPDGAGGFPGELRVCVAFSLSEKNELRIEYKAKSDKDTVCNLTNHSYFNLGGQPTVLNHVLFINADKITDVDEELIPTGEFIDVKDTPYSFLSPKAIGTDILSDASLIRQCNGYDFNYCLNRIGKSLEKCAAVYDPESGRRMDCYTTLPGVQLYTACSTGGFKGKKHYVNHCALCLETQGFPDAPNHDNFPSTLLKAGEEYHEITVYRFSIKA